LLVADAELLDTAHVTAEFEAQAKAGRLNDWAIPRIEVVSEIPKTSVGKVDKKKLRSEYG